MLMRRTEKAEEETLNSVWLAERDKVHDEQKKNKNEKPNYVCDALNPS